jgi:hypothetical protein
VVSLEQLARAGLDRSAVKRRVASGRLIRLHRGVYAVGHKRLVREGFWLAAVLACGPGAVLSHRDAAALHDLRRSNRTRIDVTAPRRVALRGIDGHSGGLAGADVTRVRGVPVTTVARTLLDLAEVVPETHVVRALERAAQLRVDDRTAILDVLARANGRRGVRTLRHAVTTAHPAAERTRSDLEILALHLTADHGLPEPLVNTHVEGLEVDLLWRPQRVIAEVDGGEFHATPQAFERDRRRDTRLHTAGYRVVRFTWLQVTRDPGEVARCLTAMLGAPSWGRR